MVKKIYLNELIDNITEANNLYRDTRQSPLDRLLALWDLGDILFKNSVDKPHAYGWKIQEQTVGVIKRMTIARAYRIRNIWPTKKDIATSFKDIKGISILIESLPLFDKSGPAYGLLKKKDKDDLIKKMNILSANEFKNYIYDFKSRRRKGRIGEKNDRKKYLKEYKDIKENFDALYTFLKKCILNNKLDSVKDFREKVSLNERKSFANFCLSMSSKNNIILYKPLEMLNISKYLNFNFLYNSFRDLLNENNDTKRARLRRVIPPEDFIEIADMLNSIIDDEKISNYQKRVNRSIKI
jgi:hypothetical protein